MVCIAGADAAPAAVAISAGTDQLFDDVIGFVAVPATAGQVSVAAPLVDPLPVITQLVVPAIPQFSAVLKMFVQ